MFADEHIHFFVYDTNFNLTLYVLLLFINGELFILIKFHSIFYNYYLETTKEMGSILENLVYFPVILLFINFFISGIFINLIQLGLWIFLKPFSLILYRKINYYLLYILWTRK